MHVHADPPPAMILSRLRSLPVLPLVTLFMALTMLTAITARSADAAPVAQPLILPGPTPYTLTLYANADLSHPPAALQRAVVIVHGIKRNADDYFAIGQRLLTAAQLSPATTLLLAPRFMTARDSGASAQMALWAGDAWMQGAASKDGVTGITSFQALDDLLRWLADAGRFPALREVVLIGHSAGAQLMQRYAMLNSLDEALQQRNIHLRYVVSSPSSYLYASPERPDGNDFALPKAAACPDYDDYRYGLQQAPPYLARQELDGPRLFARYAGRDVRYMVGQRDTDPQQRFLDRSCAAALQGASRVARQLAYMAYEQFLAQRWQHPVRHEQRLIPGAAHGAERLFGRPEAVGWIFPGHASVTAGTE